MPDEKISDMPKLSLSGIYGTALVPVVEDYGSGEANYSAYVQDLVCVTPRIAQVNTTAGSPLTVHPQFDGRTFAITTDGSGNPQGINLDNFHFPASGVGYTAAYPDVAVTVYIDLQQSTSDTVYIYSNGGDPDVIISGNLSRAKFNANGCQLVNPGRAATFRWTSKGWAFDDNVSRNGNFCDWDTSVTQTWDFDTLPTADPHVKGAIYRVLVVADWHICISAG